jgi:hypothetical protein
MEMAAEFIIHQFYLYFSWKKTLPLKACLLWALLSNPMRMLRPSVELSPQSQYTGVLSPG